MNVSSSLISKLLLLVGLVSQTSGSDSSNTSNTKKKTKHKRVAIIGGGIGGTFVAKYLSEYDTNCDIDSISIFEESAISSAVRHDAGRASSGEVYNDNSDDRQGGRVASVGVMNGQIVEVGASIIHNANKYVTEVVEADEELVMVKPFHAGIVSNNEGEGGVQSVASQLEDTDLPTGLGIWNGSEWSLLLTKQNTMPLMQPAYLLLRYNMDLIQLKRTSTKALRAFKKLYKLLESDEDSTFFPSPDALWEAVGLYNYTQISFDALLDQLDLAKSLDDLPLYRRYLPYQGLLREELATSMNLCNYNQNNKQLNGLVGLVSFLPSGDDLFSIQGGNAKIIASAFNQSNRMRSDYCREPAQGQRRVRHIQKRIGSVISHDDAYFELFSTNDDKQKGESLGQFEIVILAAPLPQANISFYRKYHNTTMEPLPLSNLKLKNNDLPSSPSTKPYTQVITTVVSNGFALHQYFNTSKEQMPRSICVTDSGKQTDGFSCITQITSTTGIYKMFTSQKPTMEYLHNLFGSNVTLEYTKVWGGPYGGATPDYQILNATKSLPFLLYDCQRPFKGPGLFYINSIEASAAAMEISAIGAKVVSKLVSYRLGLIDKKRKTRLDRFNDEEL